MHKRLFAHFYLLAGLPFLVLVVALPAIWLLKLCFPHLRKIQYRSSVGGKIITACSIKGWRLQLLSAGHINAVRRRAGFVANIDILYTTDSFEIKYKGSDRTGYRGTEVSPTNSKWIERKLSEL